MNTLLRATAIAVLAQLLLLIGAVLPALHPLSIAFAASDQLGPGQGLVVNQPLTSPNGQYKLYLQFDGNLVLYGPDMKPIWCCKTGSAHMASAIVQSDGNFVLYDQTMTPLWNTGTVNEPGAVLRVLDSGSFGVYLPSGSVLW